MGFFDFFEDYTTDSYKAKEEGYEYAEGNRYYKEPRPQPQESTSRPFDKETAARRGKQITQALKSVSRGDPWGLISAILDLETKLPNRFPKRTVGSRMPYGKRSYAKRRTAYRPRARKVYRKKPVSYGRRRTYGRKPNPSLNLIWKAMQSRM